jgi:hypothetical protein
MSGSRITLNRTPEGAFLVHKQNPHEPHKIHAEKQAAKQLLARGLSHRMPAYFNLDSESDDILMEYIPGIDMRKGIAQGEITQDTAQRIIRELLDTKRALWSIGEGRRGQVDGYVSMQREEYPDTIQKIMNDILPALSNEWGISQDRLLTTPITTPHQVIPSLGEILNDTRRFMDTAPSLLRFTHGDATGANILVTPEGDWRLIDCEWSGYADPAEAFVRMAKWVTSAVSAIDDAHIQDDGTHLSLSLRAYIPHAALDLQEYVLSQAKTFGALLSDEGFEQRVKGYMRGSYLREMALSLKRGDMRYAVFALHMIGAYL